MFTFVRRLFHCAHSRACVSCPYSMCIHLLIHLPHDLNDKTKYDTKIIISATWQRTCIHRLCARTICKINRFGNVTIHMRKYRTDIHNQQEAKCQTKDKAIEKMLMNLRILCSSSLEYVTVSYWTFFVERMNRCLMSIAVHLVAHLLIHHLLWRRNIMLLLLHIHICRWWPIGNFLRKTETKKCIKQKQINKRKQTQPASAKNYNSVFQ